MNKTAILIKRIKKLVTSNISLLLIVLGAASNFFLVLFFKKYLPADFNTFSLYLTYIGIITSFGLLGFDQVFLRLSKLTQKGKVLIGHDILSWMLLALLAAPVFISFYFSARYENLHFIPLCITGISLNTILFTYNTFRLKKAFILSQLFNSGYKMLFFIGIIILYGLLAKNSIVYLINFTSSILLVIGIGSVFYLLKFVERSSIKTTSLTHYFFSFSTNLALLTLMTYGERILIANELGEDVFGKYFYYATIFLFPLNLLQQYIGFKELVNFKDRLDSKFVKRKLRTTFLLGVGVVLAIVFVVLIDNGNFLIISLKDDMILVLLLSIFGITKLIYSLFSAILGAKGSFKDIYALNLYSFLLLLLSLAILFFLNFSLYTIIIALSCIFIFRILYINTKYVLDNTT